MWAHDVMRARDVGEGGELTVRTAQATRNIEHLSRLLAEHLARVELDAPVGDLQLLAPEVHSLEEKSAGLLPDPAEDTESLALVLERVAARLGPENVLRPLSIEDHRMEWAVHWQPAALAQPRKMAPPVDLPQPAFCFPKPLSSRSRTRSRCTRGRCCCSAARTDSNAAGGIACLARMAPCRRRRPFGTTGWRSAPRRACCGCTRPA